MDDLGVALFQEPSICKYTNNFTRFQNFQISEIPINIYNIYIYRSDPIRPLQFVAASFTSEGYLKMMGKIAFPAQFLACLSLGEHEVAGFFFNMFYIPCLKDFGHMTWSCFFRPITQFQPPFQSISGFALPSVIHNNQTLLQVSYSETSAAALCGTTGI